MSQYRDIVIETYEPHGEPSSEKVRARPMHGQGLSTESKVSCSRKMREGHPIGTRFIIQAKVTDREGGTHYLYSNPAWPYKIVTDEEAGSFINKNHE